ncbi:2779_t:CDS:2 [Cetraspora pellucida]|uniref:2779_t:CDS:1 n=1 Tax=Cetraspora pellucida TaxID=1433469 RepID=A0ACA9K6H0_9GLOM|nr:2779_t:CDS:2 [Cetraspora pellucida]
MVRIVLSGYEIISAVWTGLIACSNANTITVNVADNGLVFSPQNVTNAKKGDVVSFSFVNGKHSIVQSDTPGVCINSTTATSRNYQILLVSSGIKSQGDKYDYTITQSDGAVYFFCNYAQHCLNGEWGVIYVGSSGRVESRDVGEINFINSTPISPIVVGVEVVTYRYVKNVLTAKNNIIQWHIVQKRNDTRHIVQNKENRLDQIVQTNTANSNETISNIEFDDMKNNDDNLEEQLKEIVMQMTENINNFNTDDQIIYNEAVIESFIQAIHNIQGKTLED